MKKFLFTLLSLLFLAAVSLFWFYQNSRPLSADTKKKDFLIVRGSSASKIADDLQKQGLIKSALAFKIYVQATGRQKSILAGEFSLSSGDSLSAIVEALLAGPKELWVTIPEGLRREEAAERFVAALEKKGEEAGSFRSEFLAKSSGKEGFLFPDTYLFPKTATASAAVAKMLSTFDLRVDAKMKEDIAKSAYSLNEIVTMASILERETLAPEEKPVVSGILFKRLEAGWPLQVDATVQYAVANSKLKAQNSKLDKWWEPVTKEDLETKSPYNSYKYLGLPPAPIANPGLESIRAAVYPQDSPYWYYLHDGQGKIHYSRTLEEHNQNVRTYLGK